jgi:hypothetical protein
LRKLARDLGDRLLAEKPGSLSRRISAYWATAETFDEAETADGHGGNVIALNR